MRQSRATLCPARGNAHCCRIAKGRRGTSDPFGNGNPVLWHRRRGYQPGFLTLRAVPSSKNFSNAAYGKRRYRPVDNEDNPLKKVTCAERNFRELSLVGFVVRTNEIIPQSWAVSGPCCEHCNAQMWLVSIEPEKPDHDKRTFECPRCQDETVEIVKYR